MDRRCILRIESLHASFRRRVHVRGAQTKGEVFEELAADWIVQQSRCRSSYSLDLLDVGQGPQRGRAIEYQRAPSRWNLYQRDRAHGALLQNDPSANSLAHRALDDAAKTDLSTRCSAAQGVAGQPHAVPRFGETRQDMERAAKRALALRHKAEVSTALALQGDDLLSTDICARSVVAKVLADPTMTSLPDMVAAMQHDLRSLSSLRRERRDADMQCLARWSETQGAERLTEFLALRPQLEPMRDALIAIPDRHDTVIAYIGNPKRSALTASVIAPPATDTIMQDWDNRCQPIIHIDCPVIEEPPQPAVRKPTCREAGVCLCSARGRQVYSMRNAFLRSMKQSIHPQGLKGDADDCKEHAGDLDFLRELQDVIGEDLSERRDVRWCCLGAHPWAPHRSAHASMTVRVDAGGEGQLYEDE
ncbi:unnamed protein product, partial [Prorocentrum cordatum]